MPPITILTPILVRAAPAIAPTVVPRIVAPNIPAVEAATADPPNIAPIPRTIPKIY